MPVSIFIPMEKRGGRKTKWIPTGLPERNNKRQAERITEQLKGLFERDGTFVEKYACAINPIEKIAQEISDLPEVTLESLRELLGERDTDGHSNSDLERILEIAESAPSAHQEQPSSIRKMLFCDYMVLWLERLAPTLDRGTYGSYKGYVHGRTYAYFHDLAVTVEENCGQAISRRFTGIWRRNAACRKIPFCITTAIFAKLISSCM